MLWLRRLWRSAFPRPLVARTDRERAQLTRFTFLLHLRPVRLPAATLPWRHTMGLGGSSLVLVALQALTGILMMLVYRPVPEAAYASVAALESDVAFGTLVRGIHWWGANLLVVVMLAHVARVSTLGDNGAQVSRQEGHLRVLDDRIQGDVELDAAFMAPCNGPRQSLLGEIRAALARIQRLQAAVDRIRPCLHGRHHVFFILCRCEDIHGHCSGGSGGAHEMSSKPTSASSLPVFTVRRRLPRLMRSTRQRSPRTGT